MDGIETVPREAQNDKWIRRARQESARLAECRMPRRSVHLPLLPVGDQLVEHQSVDVAPAGPQHHEHDDLELVQADMLVRQGHRSLDDELAEQWREDLR